MSVKAARRFLSVGMFLAASVCLSCSGDRSGDSPSVRHYRFFTFSYDFVIRNVPLEAKTLMAWVPVPVSDAHQRRFEVTVKGDRPYDKVTEPENGNAFLRFDLSGSLPEEASSIPVAVSFRVQRSAYRVSPMARETVRPSPSDLARFLAPDRLVPVNGKIADEARRVAGTGKDPMIQARRLYDHIIKSMKYDKSGKGWGRGDALYACDLRTGNCTDFHSLFIGEARSLNIPARFIMGFPLPPGVSQGEIPGYHCWGEFYVKDRGWVPLDASEAYKFPEKREELFGGLDADRIAFTIGRDIKLPDASASPLNYVIYPHVEIDGKPHTAVEHLFSFKDEAADSTIPPA